MLTNGKALMAQLTDQLYLCKVLICPPLGKRCLTILLSTCSHLRRCQCLKNLFHSLLPSFQRFQERWLETLHFPFKGKNKDMIQSQAKSKSGTRHTHPEDTVEIRGVFMMHSCICAFIIAQKCHILLADLPMQ